MIDKSIAEAGYYGGTYIEILLLLINLLAVAAVTPTPPQPQPQPQVSVAGVPSASVTSCRPSILLPFLTPHNCLEVMHITQ